MHPLKDCVCLLAVHTVETGDLFGWKYFIDVLSVHSSKDKRQKAKNLRLADFHGYNFVQRIRTFTFVCKQASIQLSTHTYTHRDTICRYHVRHLVIIAATPQWDQSKTNDKQA